MKLFILSLRDIKANLYNIPIFTPNINVTLRDLRDLVNDPQGKENWQKHPEDFELWELGTWDTETAEWDDQDGRKQLLALSTMKAN